MIREKQMESERRSLTNELKRSTMESSIKTVRYSLEPHNSLHAWLFFMLLLLSADFFKN